MIEFRIQIYCCEEGCFYLYRVKDINRIQFQLFIKHSTFLCRWPIMRVLTCKTHLNIIDCKTFSHITNKLILDAVQAAAVRCHIDGSN
jgi:hypothetical protein